ncbi:nitrate reductase subunit beta [Enterobacter asburiae]|uniref:Nitrate reductase subunit beta n=1 Tax=Enterobacter asburiae TaxID=61645 RepID=A0A376FBW6_ENTAS|nr:nitrate reductase subunit beta [Enterobacter asburiae]
MSSWWYVMMKNINWLDGEGNDQVQERRKMKIRSQVGMVLNLDKCIGCHTCSVTCKNVWTSREGMEYAWFNNVESKPGTGFPTDWEKTRRSGRAAGSVKSTASCSRAWVTARCCWVKSSLTRTCRASTITTSRSTTTTRTCTTRRKASTSRSPVLAPLITGQRMDKITSGPNWEEILGGEFEKRAKRPELREHAEGDVRPVRKHLHDVSAAPV